MADFKWTHDSLTPSLEALNPQMNAGLAAISERQAVAAEAYAKTNAPWRDRTCNARNGLFAVAQHRGTGRAGMMSHAVIIGHSVPYGFWLEVRWSGEYEIIRPTMHVAADEMMQAAIALLGKITS